MENKEQLVERAKQLATSDRLVNVANQLKDLKRAWRRLESEEESLYDKELSEVFYGYLDQISARSNEVMTSVEDHKKELIEKAKEVLNQKNFKKATAEMNDLMEQWKQSGRSTKEVDDGLWAQFKEVRDEFFANRNAYYENLTETFKANKQAKKDLIEKAKEINQIENIKELTDKMNELMEEWKKTGTAGRDTDDALWKEFAAERKAFFNKKNSYYDGLKKMYNERVAAKKEIIAEAKMLLARSEFTEEEVASVKALRNKWKEIGNAGRDNEESLWQQFNETLDKYFENMRIWK
ncbi:MAG: DUF349 domain-containing protein [Erysipelotrichaceae bacterium]|nr:DUF349 domain-containing protein [Erysipelotrichaceae bacterium]MBQ7223805.1 DUF349 domain-containing protein [Erysipelotrichaceae bacterium]